MQPGRSKKLFILLKYMPFKDNPPHRVSQFLLKFDCINKIENCHSIHIKVNHMINNNKHLYCAFIDFSKAFDYVVRENLWLKLIKNWA